MTSLNHLLLAAAAVATLSVTIARGGEPLLSPHAQSNQPRYAPAGSSVNDPNLVREIQSQPGSPKGKDLAYSLRKVPSSGSNIDLAHASRPSLSPKDSRYEAALRENAMKQLQIAPLK